MALLSPPPKMQFFGDDGLPLAGGFVYTYEKDTTTPLATYTDSTGSQANTNPVVLDSQGRANIWLQIVPYSFVIYNSLSELQSCSGPIEFPPSAVSGSDIAAYSDIVVYNFPDQVAGSDGFTYRCVGTNILDDDPVGSETGAWVNLSSLPSVNLTGTPTAPTAAFGTNTTQIATTAFVQTALGAAIGREIIGGDITRTALTTLSITACECWDSTRGVLLKTTETKTITAPTGSTWAANTTYHIYQVRVISGSTIEFRAYATEGGAAADTAINAYRWRGFWRTDAVGNLYSGVLVKDRIAFTAANYLGLVVGSATSTGNGTENVSRTTVDVDISAIVPLAKCKSVVIGQSTYGGSGPNQGYGSVSILNEINGGIMVGLNTIRIIADSYYSSTTVMTGVIKYIDLILE